MWEEETTDNKFIGCFLNTDCTDYTDFLGKGHGLGLYWV